MPDTEPQALSDILVLDLSTRLSGAFAARQLADLGADVVLIEAPEGHPLRIEPPFLDDKAGPECSLLHGYANFNKRSVLLEEGDALRRALIARADVVVTSSPASFEDVERLAKDEAILLAVTPHGITGPRAHAPGNDLTAYALSGWAALNGLEGQPPLKGSHNQVGYLSGTFAACGAISALVERQRSGQGQVVDVSETEALTVTAGPSLLSTAYEGRNPDRHVGDIFSGPVPTSDGYVSITFSRAHFWRDAMNALGLEELAEDPRYTDTWARRQYRADLAPRIEAKVAERDRWGIFEHLGLLRCVCGVVLDMRDLATNPHLHDRGLPVTVEADGRSFQVPGAPYKMSRTPWTLRRSAPRLGEHTDEVIASWLGEGAA